MDRVCRFCPSGQVLHTLWRAAPAPEIGNFAQIAKLGKVRFRCAGASKSTQKAHRTIRTYPGTSRGAFVALL